MMQRNAFLKIAIYQYFMELYNRVGCNSAMIPNVYIIVATKIYEHSASCYEHLYGVTLSYSHSRIPFSKVSPHVSFNQITSHNLGNRTLFCLTFRSRAHASSQSVV